MKIEVKNLGPITSATIDLSKKLNVFCGENNTGKSYLATIINKLEVFNLIDKGSGLVFTENIDSNGFYIDPQSSFPTPYSLESYSQSFIEQKFGLSSNEYNELFPALSLNVSFDPKSVFNNASFNTKLIIKNYVLGIRKDQGSTKVYIELPVSFPEKHQGETFRKDTFNLILRAIFRDLFEVRSFFTPVDRISIPFFSKELSSNREKSYLNDVHQTKKTDGIKVTDIESDRVTRYPEPIRDSLESESNLVIGLSKREMNFNDLAQEIETELLKGSLEFKTIHEFYFSPSEFREAKFPFKVMSSTIKSLASLVFYLRHLAREGDLVIIDEPELNLHPDNQIVITRFFARLIQRGFKLLISTHSDYIIREINNLIMVASLGENEKTLATELGYKENEFIKPEDVGVHYFHFKNAKEVEVVDLEVKNFGFEVPSIEDTINELNHRAGELYYALNTDNPVENV